MNTKLQEIYSKRQQAFSEQLSKVKKTSISLSWLRVLTAGVLITVIYFAIGIPVLWWLAIVAIAMYAFLVATHEKLNVRKKMLDNLVNINMDELRSLAGDHSGFDEGSDFIDPSHRYSVDLDIFGKGSVYQRINRTCTEPGKERLAHMLAYPLTSIEEIIHRQKAVEELSHKLNFRQDFQATGMLSGEKKEDQQKLLDWLNLPSMIYGKKSYKVFLWASPVVAISTLLYWIFTGSYLPFALTFLVQWTVIGIHSKRVTLFQDYIGSKRYLLEKFAAHFKLLKGEHFTSVLLTRIASQAQTAERELNVIAARSRALDLRLNLFANLFLNTTVLYELQCVYKLEEWREKNKAHLKTWLMAVSEADALNSFATFRFNHPHYVFPEISNTLVMHATHLGHPLIPERQRICNDMSLGLDAKLWIVTGANMAGKSTFLRAVGLNVVLALSGSVVCANAMTCPLIGIHTGMRNNDSINENQSYFFAELLRLQTIVQELKQGERLLILLDEILKGTNSSDKLTGSQELLRQLVHYPCMGLIATHDLALGEMEKEYPEKIQNRHFETFINGDELSFDYKLKRGVTTGKNATFLMKKMGIIENGHQR